MFLFVVLLLMLLVGMALIIGPAILPLAVIVALVAGVTHVVSKHRARHAVDRH